jgi:hypothetical protein
LHRDLSKQVSSPPVNFLVLVIDSRLDFAELQPRLDRVAPTYFVIAIDGRDVICENNSPIGFVSWFPASEIRGDPQERLGLSGEKTPDSQRLYAKRDTWSRLPFRWRRQPHVSLWISVLVGKVMLTEFQNSPRVGEVEYLRIGTISQREKLVQHPPAVAFGFLTDEDRPARQVAMAYLTVGRDLRPALLPDEVPVSDVDVFYEAPITPEIGGAGEQAGIRAERIQKIVTPSHFQLLDSSASVEQNDSQML